MQRRTLLQATPALALAPWSAGAQDNADKPSFRPTPPLARVRAEPDRLIDFAVCTRPFRARGPRIEAQRLFGKTVVHNYGHGGSGWSLSWGSAQRALALLKGSHERRLAVIGCGAIGLTTARLAQRAGYKVRIYCKDRPPEVRSSAATGLWSPDSRIVTEANATREFSAAWEAMARASFKVWQSHLGFEGEPVAWHDMYLLSDAPFDQPMHSSEPDLEPDYPDLEERIRDLRPKTATLRPAEHPFRAPHVKRFTQMAFNLTVLQRMLVDDFLREGGEIVHREFTSPRQWAGLPERAIVNCTGYGARALLKDDSITPVRGQVARLIPQPEVDYGIFWRGHNVAMVPRRDGLIVQAQRPTDWNNEDAAVDRAHSEDAVRRLAAVFG